MVIKIIIINKQKSELARAVLSCYCGVFQRNRLFLKKCHVGKTILVHHRIIMIVNNKKAEFQFVTWAEPRLARACSHLLSDMPNNVQYSSGQYWL